MLRWEAVPSPDGKRIAHHDKDQRLFVLDVASGEERRIDASKVGGFEDLAWSPDGRFLAYVAPADNAFRRIRIWSADDGKTHELTSDRFESWSPSFSPDGKWIYFLSDRNLVSAVPSPWGSYAPEPFLAKATKVYHLPLTAGLRSPWSPRDELHEDDKPAKENEKDKDQEKKEKGKERKREGEGAARSRGPRRAPARGPGAPGELRRPDGRREGDLLPLLRGRGDQAGAGRRDDRAAGHQGRDRGGGRDPCRAVRRRQDAAGGQGRRPLPDSLRGQEGRSRQEGSGPVGLAPAGAAAAGVAADVPGGVAPGARLLLRPRGCTAWTGTPCGTSTCRSWIASPSRAELSDVLGQLVVASCPRCTSSCAAATCGRDGTTSRHRSWGACWSRADEGWRVVRIYQAEPDEPERLAPLARPDVGVREGDVLARIDGVATTSVAHPAVLLRGKAGTQVLLEIAPREGGKTRDGRGVAHRRRRRRRPPLHRLGAHAPARGGAPGQGRDRLRAPARHGRRATGPRGPRGSIRCSPARG